MALIGLVLVSTDKQKTQRQHNALDPICLGVFEEKISRKLNTDDRPALLEALSHIRDGDMLEGIAAGEHTEDPDRRPTGTATIAPAAPLIRAPDVSAFGGGGDATGYFVSLAGCPTTPVHNAPRAGTATMARPT